MCMVKSCLVISGSLLQINSFMNFEAKLTDLKHNNVVIQHLINKYFFWFMLLYTFKQADNRIKCHLKQD